MKGGGGSGGLSPGLQRLGPAVHHPHPISEPKETVTLKVRVCSSGKKLTTHAHDSSNNYFLQPQSFGGRRWRTSTLK